VVRYVQQTHFRRRKISESDYNIEVFCTLQIEGTHNWPTCPFDEVDYLRVPHRHIFHIKAFALVSHTDRDVEFIMLKHDLERYFQSMWFNFNKGLCEFGAKSCEMIAIDLIETFGLTRCEVSEDNENGAIVTCKTGT